MRRRNAVEGSLRGMLPGLGLDELRILERQAEKMLRHKREYGELVIATDTRNHRAEAADEHRDALFYILVEEIKRSDERADRLRCEAADEMRQLLPIDRGLTELRNAAPITAPDYPSAHEFDLSDLGGEGGF